MIGPSHLRPALDLASLFTNRNRAKQQFLAALDNRQGTDRYRALNWHGVGGDKARQHCWKNSSGFSGSAAKTVVPGRRQDLDMP